MNVRKGLETWWLNPLAVLAVATLPFIVSAHLLSESSYRDLWKTQKHLNETSAVMTLATLAAFAFGYALSLLGRRRQPEGQALARCIDTEGLFKLFLISAALSIFGYLAWTGVLVRNVGLSVLFATLKADSGASYAIREAGSTVPGITTMTQFGMAAVILGGSLLRTGRYRIVQVILACLILLSILRAFIWSERLAAIELLVPLGVLALARPGRKFGRRMRVICCLAPFLAGAGLYLYFTAFEFFRSWSATYAVGDLSIWAFAWTRLAGYYITALNNGMLMYSELGRLPLPYYVLEWFWKLPGLSILMPYEQITGLDFSSQGEILKTMANPEFTNPSGIFPYFLDFGSAAYLFWICCGAFAGFSYQAFRRQRLGGLLSYPFLFVGLLELSRVPYLTTSRALPTWGFLIISYVLLRTRDGTGERSLPLPSPERAEAPR